ncbi:hypothetical protein EZS27_042789, partial [termite gut metagenome]
LLQLPVNVKSPEVTSESEIEFVKTAINELEEAMFGITSNFPDKYKNLIDINSFVNFLLVNEIVHNGELGHPKSTYMYKRQGGKIGMGPLWDFDWAFGYSGEGQNYFYSSSDLLYYDRNVSPGNGIGTYFFTQFFKDPEFRLEYKKRWNEVKASISDIDKFVQAQGAYLQKSAIENTEKWHNLEHTYQIYCMRKWLEERI